MPDDVGRRELLLRDRVDVDARRVRVGSAHEERVHVRRLDAQAIRSGLPGDRQRDDLGNERRDVPEGRREVDVPVTGRARDRERRRVADERERGLDRILELRQADVERQRLRLLILVRQREVAVVARLVGDDEVLVLPHRRRRDGERVHMVIDDGAADVGSPEHAHGVGARAADDRGHDRRRLVELEHLLLPRRRQLGGERVAADGERVARAAELDGQRLDGVELDATRLRVHAALEVERGAVQDGAEAADRADLRAARSCRSRLRPGVQRAGSVCRALRRVGVVVERRIGAAVEDDRVDALAADDCQRADAVRRVQARPRDPDDAGERAVADGDDVVAVARIDFHRTIAVRAGDADVVGAVVAVDEQRDDVDVGREAAAGRQRRVVDDVLRRRAAAQRGRVADLTGRPVALDEDVIARVCAVDDDLVAGIPEIAGVGDVSIDRRRAAEADEVVCVVAAHAVERGGRRVARGTVVRLVDVEDVRALAADVMADQVDAVDDDHVLVVEDVREAGHRLRRGALRAPADEHLVVLEVEGHGLGPAAQVERHRAVGRTA